MPILQYLKEGKLRLLAQHDCLNGNIKNCTPSI